MIPGTAWSRFRRLPVWGQVLVWLFLWPVPVALFAVSRPPGRRRPWWALTAVLALAWAGAAVAGQDRKPESVEQGGQIRGSTTTTTTSGDPETMTTTAPADAPAPGSTGATTATSAPAGPGQRASTTTTAPPPPAADSRLAPLAQLRVAPEGPRTGYNRDLFPHWIDADGDRCDTREEVLIAESNTPAQVDPYGCKVSAGDWFSLYDGVSTSEPGTFDIDHVVALGEAWDSGASAWDTARRRAYANDVDHPQALRAVSASSNRSKSDLDPAQWKPSREAAWCEYARDWVTVKVAWDLSADEDEVADLRVMLRTCQGSQPPAPASPTNTKPPTPTTASPPSSGGAVTVTALDCWGESMTVGNGTSAPVDLTGWSIHDEGAKHTFHFPDGYTLSPGASVTIRSGGPAGAGELFWTSQPVWNNDGDTAYLVDPAGVVFSKPC